MQASNEIPVPVKTEPEPIGSTRLLPNERRILMRMITAPSESPPGRSSDQFSANGFVANDIWICYIEVVLQKIGILGSSLVDAHLALVDLMVAGGSPKRPRGGPPRSRGPQARTCRPASPVLASRWFSDWCHPLLTVKPETVLGCQRTGWRAYWRWRGP